MLYKGGEVLSQFDTIETSPAHLQAIYKTSDTK